MENHTTRRPFFCGTRMDSKLWTFPISSSMSCPKLPAASKAHVPRKSVRATLLKCGNDAGNAMLVGRHMLVLKTKTMSKTISSDKTTYYVPLPKPLEIDIDIIVSPGKPWVFHIFPNSLRAKSLFSMEKPWSSFEEHLNISEQMLMPTLD